MYPKTTVAMDSMGSLYIWEGEHVTEKKSNYWIVADGKEAHLFIQEGSCSLQSFICHLTPEENEELQKGYSIVTTNIPDDYFTQN